MLHNIEQIKSLEAFVKKNAVSNLSYDELFNKWIKETGEIVQDADTIDYYIQLIPMMERGAINE